MVCADIFAEATTELSMDAEYEPFTDSDEPGVDQDGSAGDDNQEIQDYFFPIPFTLSIDGHIDKIVNPYRTSYNPPHLKRRRRPPRS